MFIHFSSILGFDDKVIPQVSEVLKIESHLMIRVLKRANLGDLYVLSIIFLSHSHVQVQIALRDKGCVLNST